MKQMKNFNQLKKFIQNNPLIVTEPSLAAIKRESLNDKNGGLFFGVGIVSKDKISTGVPFDILAMFFACEQLRRILNFKKVIVLIADTHAISNEKFSDKTVKQVTTQTLQTLRNVISNFHLASFELFLASDICGRPDFQLILSKIPPMDNQYLRLEVADCLWLQRNENLKIKVGWTMRKDNNEIGHDERFFDQQIKVFCPFLSFIHLKPGHTFNKERPRVSPYLATTGEDRIIIKKDENAARKIAAAKLTWQDNQLGGGTNHLAAVVRAFENLFGRLPSSTLEAKIQFILNKAIGTQAANKVVKR